MSSCWRDSSVVFFFCLKFQKKDQKTCMACVLNKHIHHLGERMSQHSKILCLNPVLLY